MKKKRIITMIAAMALAVGLAGCTGGMKLPEGDVKIVNQETQGVVELLLEASNYGRDKSSVTSVVLPVDSEYEVTLVKEKYSMGELVENKEISKYTTETIAKDSIMHIKFNVAKLNDGEADKSIISIAEIDRENTEDSKNPSYKVSKFNDEAIDFDSRTVVDQSGKALDEEQALVAFVKFNEDDNEKAAINLDTYKDEVSKYKEATIFKIKVSKK